MDKDLMDAGHGPAQDGASAGADAAELPAVSGPSTACERDGAEPPEAERFKRSLRAVAQERNQARARVRELEAELEAERARAAQAAARAEAAQAGLSGLAPRAELDAAREEAARLSEALETARAELRRSRAEVPLLHALARRRCADPADALRLVASAVRADDEGNVEFYDPDDPSRPLRRPDGTPLGFDEFAALVLERKPHLALRPPAVGSGAPDGAAGAEAPVRPDSRRDPEGYRRYYIRRYGQDPRSLISP